MRDTNFGMKVLVVACSVAAATWASESRAADWVMIQGAEKFDTTYKVFGVLQGTYVNNFGCENLSGLQGPAAANNGLVINNCRVGPELRNDEEGLLLENAVLGVRGNIVPTRINYFLSINAGENGANYKPFKSEREHLVSLTDATVTMSYVPAARLRVGLMRKPGPEELYQGLDAMDYVFPTDFIARVQAERFVTGNAKGAAPIPGQGHVSTVSEYGYDFDAGRDWGVMLFDAFKGEKWTSTYAAMLGNGNGIHQDDNNDKKDVNLYVSTEYDLPGGKGQLKHGVKFYGYHQQGVRNFIIDAVGTSSEDFDRIRYGIGMKALGPIFGEDNGRHRFAFEFMFAEGMIHYTPTANTTDAPYGGLMQFGAERGNKAKGTTVDYGYYLNKNWQFDVRWSRDNVLYEQAGVWKAGDERMLEYVTLGFNYHFRPNARLTVNYEYRDVTAPNPQLTPTGAINQTATSNQNVQVNAVQDRAGVRFTYTF